MHPLISFINQCSPVTCCIIFTICYATLIIHFSKNILWLATCFLNVPTFNSIPFASHDRLMHTRFANRRLSFLYMKLIFCTETEPWLSHISLVSATQQIQYSGAYKAWRDCSNLCSSCPRYACLSPQPCQQPAFNSVLHCNIKSYKSR